MKDRYSRQEIYKNVGKKGQKKIQKATISVIGMGALGTVTAELLTRAGIGMLKLFDRDKIELNNLQRQFLYEEKDIGKLKATTATKQLKKINSEAKIISYVENITPENISLIESDLILECTDNIETKFLINRYCSKKNLNWISASAIEDTGVVIPFINSDKCLECIFEPTKKLKTCKQIGVLNTTTTITSSIQVAETIKAITNQTTKNNLIRINTTNNTLEKINYRKKPNCKGCEKEIKQRINLMENEITKNCDSYYLKGKKINLKILQKYIRNSKLTIDGLFSEEITVLNDGKAIIKAKNEKEARRIYERTINFLS